MSEIKAPVISGIVKVLGADKEPDAHPQEGDFYLAQVETTPQGLALLAGLKVQPGMAGDGMFKASERSFMRYRLKPPSDKTVRAFKK
jgi:protease secretion system membrane fusion protein